MLHPVKLTIHFSVNKPSLSIHDWELSVAIHTVINKNLCLLQLLESTPFTAHHPAPKGTLHVKVS